MGAVVAEAKENDFWARVQTTEKPDSKARVRFLLDEIALLQVRFDNKEQQKFQKKIIEPKNNQVISEGFATENEHKDEAFVNVDDQDQQNEYVPEVLNVEVPVKIEPGFVGNTMEFQQFKAFFEFAEEKLRILTEERAGFYEKAEKELRVGKVERLVLAKLLQLEKSKLQRHRKELEETRDKWNCLENENARTNNLRNAVQIVIKKMGKLLDDRESLQLKFEVQVELGHFFRLLKLLELQKAKDDSSKRELEKDMQDFRVYLEQTKEDVHNEIQETDTDQSSAGKQDSDCESPSETEPGILEVIAPTESETCATPLPQSYGESDGGLIRHHCQRCKKEAKGEVMKLMAEQEQKWKAQLLVLQEMERRLALSELECQRLSYTLKDGQSRREVESFSSPGDLPQGYSSIYFSPIFQERKHQHDGKDVEIRKLKSEVNDLRFSLKETAAHREEQSLTDRLQIPAEEKTISIDASSSNLSSLSGSVQLDSMGLFLGRNLSDGDRQFLTLAVHNVSMIFQQHRQELRNISFSKTSAEKEACVEAVKSLSLQVRQLSEDLESQINATSSRPETKQAEAEVGQMKADMDRIADEHAQELDRKEKTLAYAQELNLHLANDMSKAENALAELRMEYTGLKVSLETKLKDSKNEAEEISKTLRRDLGNLQEKLTEKERLIQELSSRAQACQRETDAAVLEKNEVLKRLQRLMEEMETQKMKIRGLEDEAVGRKEQFQLDQDTATELQEAREELKKVSDAHQALEKRYNQLQSRLLETEYELAQRESALERLALHLAASTIQLRDEAEEAESLRSKHTKKEHARKSIQEAEEKIAIMAAEMSKAKTEMEEIKSQSFQLLHRLRKRTAAS